MEILEKPKVKCKACGCVYTFGKDDLIKRSDCVRRDMVDDKKLKDVYINYYSVSCPICGDRHIIRSENEDRI